MFRLYDWECRDCGDVHEEAIEFPQGDLPPKCIVAHCYRCDHRVSHHRLFPLFSDITDETAFNPMVNGGKYDTTGHAPLPQLPQMPPGTERNSDNLKQHYASKEWREACKARDHKQQENKAKQKRADLIRAGKNINMRRDKLPGDPKITA